MAEEDFELIIRPGFYAVIPATVRYDAKLCANAKLLYGEITALCSEKAYCWASNDYFAKLYKVSTKSASRWVNQLAEMGYLKLSYSRISKINNCEIRRISLCDSVQPPGQKCPDPLDKNVLDPLDKIVPHIITNKDEYIRESAHTQENSDSPLSKGSRENGNALPKLEPAKTKAEPEQKSAYGKNENVMLTAAEYEKLQANPDGLTAVEHLSDYIAMKGYKAKSHYLAICKWVFTALREQTLKGKEIEAREKRLAGGGSRTGTGIITRITNADELNAVFDELNRDII